MQGDKVDSTGTVVAHGPDYVSQVGVEEGEGAQLLNQQGHHVETPKSSVKLSE